MKLILGTYLLLLAVGFANAETLCQSCEIAWVDTEQSNGDVRFGTKEDVGSGPCVGTYMTTISTVTERQRDQIYSSLLAALMSGAKVTAHGTGSQCGTFHLLTIKSPN